MNPERYKKQIYPFSEHLDPETAHDLTVQMLHLAEAYPFTLKVLERALCIEGKRHEDERLHICVKGIELENPLTVAAGFDKEGECLKSLYALGFSAVVAGTVTEYPQKGNPRPRIRRVKPSLINSMGFPSHGIDVLRENLSRYRGQDFPVGVSIGINKNIPSDEAALMYRKTLKKIYPYADYFEINVSSPNTPGLTSLQDKEKLIQIVSNLRYAMLDMGSLKPLFVKISPDLTARQIDDVIDAALTYDFAIVATNTTQNPLLKSHLGLHSAAGGLSGEILRELSNKVIRHIYKEASGKVQIVGAGGVTNSDNALNKIMLGARSLAVYTGFVFEGPQMASKVNEEISEWMTRSGVNSLEEIIGQIDQL